MSATETATDTPQGAVSSEVERLLYTQDVGGSIPSPPTTIPNSRCPRGSAPSGARQLIGDVWEWTGSDFEPYPGFTAFPYKEYSEVFFGPDYKVLRGGSFAVDQVACRGTFRNWDYPIRRQIFSGFRTARDATAHHTDAAELR